MSRHGRPGAGEFAPFYAGYIERVPEGDILRILADQWQATERLLRGAEERADFRYADGKWSVKQVVGHLADTERIMAYRALRIARGDATPLPGFDENAFTAAGAFDARELGELVDDLGAARAATLHLLRGLPDAAWTRTGTANDAPTSVRAIACILAGHELHHRAILEERYGLAPHLAS
jgi:uncharacterized damage-inducible protein DinB